MARSEVGFPRNALSFAGERIAEVFNSKRVPMRQLDMYQRRLRKEGTTDEAQVNYQSAQWLAAKAKTLNMGINLSESGESMAIGGDLVELFRGNAGTRGGDIFAAFYWALFINERRQRGKRKGVAKLLNEYLPKLNSEQRDEVKTKLAAESING